MCGIVGYYRRNGTVEVSVLESMLDRIAHRGPDDSGTWVQGPVGLGHARLSILDLSTLGHQPMVTADGQGIIAYNGEVYNFQALRRRLEESGIEFRSHTDTEVVLYALHHWGPEQCVAQFNGMFAFAYYNLRDQTLWLGRDRLGIKPLYVARTGSSFVFGSEIKALLRNPEVVSRPDMHALVTQIVYERLDGTWTPFEKIESLLPGTLLKINDNDESISYFDLLRDLQPQRILDGGNEEFSTQVQRFEKCFDASVRMHLLSDAPLATICSGGLDSSLITALARDHKPDIVAYVADVEGVQESEVGRAQRVCRHLGVELRPVTVNLENYYRLWPQAVYANDQPNNFAQNVAALAVAEAIQKDGFKVVLNGDGADEVFGGYPWYVTVYKMWRRRRLHAKWIHDNRFFRSLGCLHSRLAPLDLDALAERPFTPISQFDDQGMTGRQTCAMDGAKRRLRDAALFRKLQPLPLHEERAFLARSFADIYVHLGEALRSNDRMAMWRSVEARVPFLENELIDFGLHLPCQAKYHHGDVKRLITALAMKRLPHDVVRLPKIGFSVSESMWQGMSDFLKNGMVAELLKWRRADQPEILRIIQAQPRFMFRLLCTEIWARIYFGGESQEQLSDVLLRQRRLAGSNAIN
jgi:asparagine synthase (glutamine-hydrolysing)